MAMACAILPEWGKTDPYAMGTGTGRGSSSAGSRKGTKWLAVMRSMLREIFREEHVQPGSLRVKLQDAGNGFLRAGMLHGGPHRHCCLLYTSRCV